MCSTSELYSISLPRLCFDSISSVVVNFSGNLTFLLRFKQSLCCYTLLYLSVNKSSFSEFFYRRVFFLIFRAILYFYFLFTRYVIFCCSSELFFHIFFTYAVFCLTCVSWYNFLSLLFPFTFTISASAYVGCIFQA